MRRRDIIKLSIIAAGSLASTTLNAQQSCPTDGTPAQFIPKKSSDPKSHVNDIEKYQKCPYCGMDRKQLHHSRMLIQYSDDLPDGVCSLHCAAISLSLNVDREPKTIWVADNDPAAEIKPVVEVAQATFLVGSRIKAVMSTRSKVAYRSKDAAEAARAVNGGELVDFDKALLAAYADMAQDVLMIRKNREERRKRAMQQKEG
jgi:copper chaperone NosL